MFSGDTVLTDSHDALQNRAGSVVWFSEFVAKVARPKRTPSRGTALYVALPRYMWCNCGSVCHVCSGVLPFDPGVITIYIPRHQQNRFPGISIVLQFQRTLAFSFESLDFLLLTDYTTPEDIYYAARFGVETVTVRFVLINSDKPCDPRSNLDLVHFMWNTYTHFCTNYAVVMLQLSPKGTKVLYTRHYKAEIGGGDTRTCLLCSDVAEDPRTLYGLQCRVSNSCSCTVCVRQPLSLKSAASKIVFGMYNLSKFCFDEHTMYSEYVMAAKHLPTQQLVPNMDFPNTLYMRYVQ
jgi:hypothetical protein